MVNARAPRADGTPKPAPDVVLLRPPMIVPRWAHVSPMCPPLGLAYVAAAIRRAGYGVRCVDAVGEAPFRRTVLDDENFLGFGLGTEEIVERVGLCSVVGVSLMFSHDWPMAKSLIRAVRRRNPDAFLIVGGEHVSAAPEFCLRDCPEIDVCVLGEGEETVVALLDALRDGAPLNSVAGIAFAAEAGPARTPSRPRIARLEEIAFPAWDLLPLENYLANGLGYGVNPGRTVPLLASRGCPYECTFCSSPQMWTTRWSARSTDDVIAEMEHYIERHQARNFDLYDLTAIIRKDWLEDFCRKIIARKWDITWQMPAGTRSEALDEESLELMHRSGQRNISYAPESGSPETLRIIKKRIDLDRIERSIARALKVGMNVKLNIIMGFPHETTRNLRQTAFFLARMAALGVHDAYVACFSPYPGSELFEELRRAGRIGEMTDEYFLMLTSYSDLRYSRSYSPHLSDRTLTLYRLGTMAMFYLISYSLHPSRLLRLLINFLRGKQESRLDTALNDMRRRLLPRKISAPASLRPAR